MTTLPDLDRPAPTVPGERTPAAPRRHRFGSAMLLLAVVVLAGETQIVAVYTPDGLARLVVFAGVALLGVVLGGARVRPPTWAVALAVLVAVRSIAVKPPLDNVVSDDRLLTGVLVVAAATALPAVVPLVRYGSTGRVAAGTLATAAAGYALVILGSRPIIDVWALLQGAGRALRAGQNPYEIVFPAAPPGQVDHCFTYLPGTALLGGPGVWLGGDARWAELALLVTAGALVAWQVRSRGGARLGLAAFVVVVPGSVYVVQQAWTEPMLLAALAATAVLADRGRLSWAAVAFGVALATKQHVLLIAPLLLMLAPSWAARLRACLVAVAVAAALTLPFLLANPARFTECTAEFFLTAEAPRTSLSLWLHLPEPVRLPLLLAALAAGYLIAWRCCPRTGGGFLVACAAVFTTVGVLNKQTFLNQWWLVTALVVAGLALSRVAPLPSEGHPSASALHKGAPDAAPEPERAGAP